MHHNCNSRPDEEFVFPACTFFLFVIRLQTKSDSLYSNLNMSFLSHGYVCGASVIADPSNKAKQCGAL